MPDARGWPDPEKPGFPENPDRDGAHLLAKDGHRTWAWWHYTGCSFQLPSPAHPAWGVSGVLDPRLAAMDWTYLKPAVAADGKPVP